MLFYYFLFLWCQLEIEHIDSCDNIRGSWSSIDLIAGSSSPSERSENGNFHADVVDGDNGPPPPSLGSSFVVKTWDRCSCIYSKACNGLCPVTSCHENSTTCVYNDDWTLIHDCASKIMPYICGNYCCYIEYNHGRCTWVSLIFQHWWKVIAQKLISHVTIWNVFEDLFCAMEQMIVEMEAMKKKGVQVLIDFRIWNLFSKRDIYQLIRANFIHKMQNRILWIPIYIYFGSGKCRLFNKMSDLQKTLFILDWLNYFWKNPFSSVKSIYVPIMSKDQFDVKRHKTSYISYLMS